MPTMSPQRPKRDKEQRGRAKVASDSMLHSPFSMRVLTLYLRSRRWAAALLWMLPVAVAAWLLGDGTMRLPGAPTTQSLSVPVLALMPALATFAIGLSGFSPWGELEGAASRSLPKLRAAHALGLMLWACLTLWPAAGRVGLIGAEWALVRNVIGFGGLACVGARLIGHSLSWIPTLLFIWILGAYGMVSAPDQLGWAWWAWPLRPATDPVASFLALATGAIGLLAWCLIRERGAGHE